MRLNVLSESYLDPDYIKRQIGARYWPAFDKAVSWQPKTRSWDWKPEVAAQAIAKGEKPVGYGWRDDLLAQLAKKYDLQNLWQCLFLPDNQDIAELVGLALARFEIASPTRHYIIGVACGYPIDDVRQFASQYIKPNEELAKGLQRHIIGDTIR